MSDRAKDGRNVFSNRNYRLVFFGALVSDLGAVLYSFAVSFYILEISGNNAFLQGLYLALCGVVFLIATPVGGVLGDRFNKAKIMFVCDGPIPEGMAVTFKDSNKLNCDISNLILVTKGENCTLTRLGLRFEDPELTEAGLGVVRLKQAISKRKRKKKRGGNT